MMQQLLVAGQALQLIPHLVNPGYGLYQSRLQRTSKTDFQFVMDMFIELTTLPQFERDQWKIDADGNGDYDDGLIERNGGTHDHKFFFHFKSMGRILHAMDGKPCYEQHRKKWNYFLNALHVLHTALCRDMYDIVCALDTRYRSYEILKKLQDHNPSTRGVLRLLYYKPGHTVVAKPHYDQSLLTFHVADSHPGLVVGNREDVYVPKGNGILLAFPGMKAEIVTEGLIPAALHAAVADEVSIREGRWSIVFFYHCELGISSEEISRMIKEKIGR